MFHQVQSTPRLLDTTLLHVYLIFHLDRSIFLKILLELNEICRFTICEQSSNGRLERYRRLARIPWKSSYRT